MSNQENKGEDILRLINDLGAETPHTAEESREALRDAGLAPEEFAEAVTERARTLLVFTRFRPEPRLPRFDARLRTWSLVTMAASAVIFVAAFTFNHRAEVQTQRQLAESTAQLVR